MGVNFLRSRQIYLAVIRPTLVYASSIWAEEVSKSSIDKLSRLQNKALRLVTGAYKATPISTLEVEAFVPPLPLYLQERARAYRCRIGFDKRQEEKRIALSYIRARTLSLRARTTLHAQLTRTATATRTLSSLSLSSSSASLSSSLSLLKQWRQQWLEAPRDKWSITLAPSPAILRLHKYLVKAESSTLIQLRTGRIGLSYFLYKRGVPDFPTPFCSCGQGRGDVNHLLFDCLLPLLPRPSTFTRNIRKEDLLSTPLLVKEVTKWAIHSLPQFDLATQLLYDDGP